jgi:acetyl/propionyl-CoA carboxylase alpha subunit
MIQRARHVEVQILGDKFGDIYHLYERDCSVQRRNQKVVERAPAPYLTEAQRAEICALGKKICAHVDYECAGTVEFLMDMDSQEFYFIEVNPRVQVEHTVTEEITGIDIVRAQILIAEGKPLSEATGTVLPGGCSAGRPCDPMPRDHRRSVKQFHPRLWAHHGLSRRHGHGHSPRWRHGLLWRSNYPLL